MICPGCGSEMPNDRRFCTNCGAALGERTIEMQSVPPARGAGAPPPPQPTRAFAGTSGPQAPPSPPQGAPVPPVPPPGPPPHPPAGFPPAKAPGGSANKSRKVIIAALVALVVLSGAAAGIIFWRVSEGNKTVVDVSKVVIERADGKKLDLDEVPLDEDLELTATFTARFKEGGKATLKLSVIDEEGEEVVGESYSVKSSDETQTETLEFSMTIGNGEPLEAKAELEVTGGDETLSDDMSIGYSAVEGEGEEAELEKARERAGAKLVEADTAIQEISSMGIDASDLSEQAADAEVQLEEATTVEEADAVYDLAVDVIAECATRKAASEADQGEASNAEACRANQNTIRDALDAYYASEGNFPNDMSDLVSDGFMSALPECPSGGDYTYQVTDFAGPAFDVICSVHGSL